MCSLFTNWVQDVLYFNCYSINRSFSRVSNQCFSAEGIGLFTLTSTYKQTTRVVFALLLTLICPTASSVWVYCLHKQVCADKPVCLHKESLFLLSNVWFHLMALSCFFFSTQKGVEEFETRFILQLSRCYFIFSMFTSRCEHLACRSASLQKQFF